MSTASCPLCVDAAPPGTRLVVENALWRVVRVLDQPAFPAFYRLIWRGHVGEFSAVSAAQRAACMEALMAIERCLIDALAPDKVNLASLGNVVPHLHWHIVARFRWDCHFPDSIWTAPRRSAEALDTLALLEALRSRMTDVDAAVVRALGTVHPEELA